MTRRPVPALRRPADVLFRGAAEPAPPAVRNEKITAYLTPGLLAAVDDYRTGLLREHRVRVDRSRVLRDLVRAALDQPEVLARLTREEEA